MKKILIAIALLISTSAFAEKKVGEYTFSEKVWDIEASYTKQDLHILIQVMGEYKGDKVFYCIEGENNINLYKNSLIELKAKFAEWAEVAAKNNVTDFKKYFDLTWPSATLYWLGSTKWHSSFAAKCLKPLFMVTDSGDKGAAAFFGTAKDWDNEYLTQKWYQIFASPEEVQSLIDALDVQGIIKQFTEAANTEDLFK